jgi:hypothetical protein
MLSYDPDAILYSVAALSQGMLWLRTKTNLTTGPEYPDEYYNLVDQMVATGGFGSNTRRRYSFANRQLSTASSASRVDDPRMASTESDLVQQDILIHDIA